MDGEPEPWPLSHAGAVVAIAGPCLLVIGVEGGAHTVGQSP